MYSLPSRRSQGSWFDLHISEKQWLLIFGCSSLVVSLMIPYFSFIFFSSQFTILRNVNGILSNVLDFYFDSTRMKIRGWKMLFSYIKTLLINRRPQFQGPDNYFSRICFDQSLADGQLDELIRNHIQSPKWNWEETFSKLSQTIH